MDMNSNPIINNAQQIPDAANAQIQNQIPDPIQNQMQNPAPSAIAAAAPAAKEEKKMKFRTSFRGFKKQDVIDFISQENRKFSEDRAALESSCRELSARADENAAKVLQIQNSFETLSKLKDREIESKTAQIAEINETLAQTSAREENLKSENARLHALLDGCDEQIRQYRAKIDEISAEYNEYKNNCENSKVDASETEDIRRENEYLREKYKALETKYEEALKAPDTYVSELDAVKGENAMLKKELSNLTEDYNSALNEIDSYRRKAVREDAYRPSYDTRYERTTPSYADSTSEAVKSFTPAPAREFARQREYSEGDDFSIRSDDRQYGFIRRSSEASDNDSLYQQKPSQKDVEADRKKVNDSASENYSDSIAKMLGDISERFKALDGIIKEQRGSVSKSIDDNYGKFSE